MAELKPDALPKAEQLRRCCGIDPIFHHFPGLGAYAIECGRNGHIHNTGFCDTPQEAIEAWSRMEDNDV